VEQADTLRTFAEVGVALAGFTGVAVVLGRRAEGAWSYVEIGQLRQLLESSLAVALLALLPLVLERLAGSPAVLWRVSNGLACLAGLGLGGAYWLRYLRGPKQSYPQVGKLLGFATTPLVGALLLAQALVALGFLERLAADLYLVALLWLVAVSAVNFVYLLLPRDAAH
jgi:hypothetical protein